MSPSLSAAIAMWMVLFAIGITVPSAPFRNRIVVNAFSWNVELNPASNPSSQAAMAPNDPWWRITAFILIVVFAFTPTNIAMLCLVSAVIGNEVTRARRFAPSHPSNPPSDAVSPALSGAANSPSASGGLPRPTGSPQASVASSPASSIATTGAPEPSRPPAFTHDGPVAPPVAAFLGLCVFFGLMAGVFVVQGGFQWDYGEPHQYFTLSATASLLSIVAGMKAHTTLGQLPAWLPLLGPESPRAPESLGATKPPTTHAPPASSGPHATAPGPPKPLK